MADVFTVLAADHAEAKALLAELESGPTKAGGADQHQLDLRKRLTQALIIEESRHEVVEEMYFWPAVREHHAAGDTLADEATAQEKQAKHILAELDKLEADDASFEALLGTFTKAAREHIEFEETQVWPGLQAVLPAQEAEELGRKIADGKMTAPTRPHPRTPPVPGVLRATGPAVAAADKARDAVSGRGDRRHEEEPMPRAQIKDEKTYRKLRDQGESKEKSARIANAAAGTSRGQVGRKGGRSGSYDDWSKQDLVRRAREIGVKGRSTMSKAQLIKALRDH
jgi:Hemerythrin HHE cation binding domain